MFGSKMMPSHSAALILLLLMAAQFSVVNSGPVAYAACEGACVTIFVACLAASLPLPGAQAACWAAMTTCANVCLPLLMAPTP